MAEIKSVPDFKCISPKQISLMISSKNNGFGKGMSLQIPRIKVPIPVVHRVFRAVGIITDKDICQRIVFDEDNKDNKNMLFALQRFDCRSRTCLTQEDALKYITNNVMYTPFNEDKETGARKKREFAVEVLNNDLFPHCKTMEQKIYFLGYMTNRLLRCSFGLEETDDRDSYMNKRIDLTGTLSEQPLQKLLQ